MANMWLNIKRRNAATKIMSQIDLEHLMRNFDEETCNYVRSIEKNTKHPVYKAVNLAHALALSYKDAIEGSGPVATSLPIRDAEYKKLPKNERANYKRKDGGWVQFANHDMTSSIQNRILKYKQSDKNKVRKLVSQLGLIQDGADIIGELTKAYEILGQLADITKIENISDKGRDRNTSGSTHLKAKAPKDTFLHAQQELNDRKQASEDGRKEAAAKRAAKLRAAKDNVAKVAAMESERLESIKKRQADELENVWPAKQAKTLKEKHTQELKNAKVRAKRRVQEAKTNVNKTKRQLPKDEQNSERIQNYWDGIAKKRVLETLKGRKRA